MIAISLQSGSNGNCIYVETGSVRLLFDAGICGADSERRLALHGRDIRKVDAVIISHDHADHVRFAGIYNRKYRLPLYMTPRTLAVSEQRHKLGRLQDVRLFLAGGALDFGGVTVQTICTPHDGVDGCAFVVSCGDSRLGLFTDLGHVFGELASAMESLDAVFLESNYDPVMLARGSYPEFLKRRIQGPEGHLSNTEAAQLLKSGKLLKWACLAHLSEQNNNPQIALKTHRNILNNELPLYVAGRYRATDILKI